MSNVPFSTLALSPHLLTSIEAMGFQYMTPIQAQSLGPILEGKDLIAQAKTGSGKTAAFGIGILSSIDVNNPFIQAMVLCPTRELADQVCKEIKGLARFIPNLKILSLCGGKPLRNQVASLEHGAHVVVGTPGRIMDHFQRRTLNTRSVRTLVLDEADRMLDMGFAEEIEGIVRELPRQRQTLLFSATFPESILTMSKGVQKEPVRVTVETTHDATQIEQIFYKVSEQDRLSALRALLQHKQAESTLVFCTTKQQCDEIAQELQQSKFSALALHGGLDQRDRDEVLVRFANKSCSILVATDVASRGIDIKNLELVVNFHVPRDPEIYIHRIGRTGRAGSTGQALTLFTSMESRKVSAIEDYQKSKVTYGKTEDLYCREVNEQAPAKTQQPPMQTLKIAGGRKDKLCKGDILGALTGKGSAIPGSEVGKIDIFDHHACVAVSKASAAKALKVLGERPIKGRSFKVKML